MQRQISAYVEDILSPFLCGYRNGFSAQHASFSMLEKWRKSLDKRGFMEGESLWIYQKHSTPVIITLSRN